MFSLKGFNSYGCLECVKCPHLPATHHHYPTDESCVLFSLEYTRSNPLAPPQTRHQLLSPSSVSPPPDIWLDSVLMTAKGVTLFYSRNTSVLSFTHLPRLPHFSYQCYIKRELCASCDKRTVAKRPVNAAVSLLWWQICQQSFMQQFQSIMVLPVFS